jgi:putative ABC transport system substrate-binding protein
LIGTACGQSINKESSHFTIGLVTNNPNGLRNVQGFRNGMADLGYIEGENVTYLFSGEPVSGSDLETTLEDLVSQKVDLIFTAGTPTGIAAHRITAESGIPVIFGVIADPLAAGVMTDLARPGGNMTGVKLSDSQDRRLELFLQIAPGIKRIFVPFNPEDAAPSSAVAQIETLASALGLELILGEARTEVEVVDLLVNLPADLDAIFLVPDSTVNARIADIVNVANAHKLPVSGPSTAQVEQGALTTYGFIHEAAGAQAAGIADRVLKGANPGELPVETTEFFLAINLATADNIGVAIPEEVLQQAEIIIRADEVE